MLRHETIGSYSISAQILIGIAWLGPLDTSPRGRREPLGYENSLAIIQFQLEPFGVA